jgi:hypothetical protein
MARMKRPNPRSRPRRTPVQGRPVLKRSPNLPSGNTARVCSRILLAAIVLYGGVRLFTARDTISIPLDSTNSQSWVLKDVGHFKSGAQYSAIVCDKPCYVISPSQSRLGVNAAEAPYVRVVFAPESSLRNPRILVSSPAEPGNFLPRKGLLRPSDLICDLRDSRPYDGIRPFASAIDRVGISFTGKLLLSRFEVSGFARLADYPLLLREAFADREPSTPHSINELFGVYLLGHSQTTWAFAFLSLAALLIFSFARTRHLRKLFIALGGTLLFLYLPWAIYLLSEVALSAERSSLRHDLYDEYSSRYGEDFASLSRELYERVPAGSRVHFVQRVIDAVPTEGNLSAFVHGTRFEPCEFGNADYYFGYRCPGIYDTARAQLTDPHSGKTATVVPVYRHDDSFVLKAAR